jgi:ribosomal protein S18 acetylase RimI-like enzyme
MPFYLRAATHHDLPFARSLTHRAMDRYYVQNQLLWSDDGFDRAWAGRENWLIYADDCVVGFISLSRDSHALYIRELHMIEAYRGLGAGTWVLEQMALKAQVPGLLRLTVFKTNPAQKLYQRTGFSVVGEEAGFWRMERVCRSTPC